MRMEIATHVFFRKIRVATRVFLREIRVTTRTFPTVTNRIAPPENHEHPRGQPSLMDGIATPRLVRNRCGLTESDVSDEVLEEFINDQQAFVELALGRPLRPDDRSFSLARSVVTDLAAIMALVRATTGSAAGPDYRIGKLDVNRRSQLDARLRAIETLTSRAQAGLATLRRSGARYKVTRIHADE
jgi:hypothetical protein